MNQERTFGVEIECFARISKEDMKERMLDFLNQAGFTGHSVVITGYSHMTDANNNTRWQIEGDGSLRYTNNSMRESYPHPMEIKTPALKGNQGLSALKAVCDALDGHATVNRSSGLHVHHGLPTETESMLKSLANAWIGNEKHFFGALPNSRQNNSYARPWGSIVRQVTEEDSLRSWYNAQGLGRRVSLNFVSYWVRKTVEFRMHSGSVEYEKISNWLLATQLFVDKAIKGIFNGSTSFDGFVNDMKKTGTVTTPDQTRVINTGGTSIFKYDAKYSKMPRRSSKKYYIINSLITGDGATAKQITDRLDIAFGVLPAGKQAKYVAGQLTNMKSKKYGFGFDIVKNRGTKMFKINREETSRTEVIEGTTETFTVSAKQKKAVTWLKSRYDHFEGIRNGGLTI